MTIATTLSGSQETWVLVAAVSVLLVGLGAPLALAFWPRSVAELDPESACELYATAIAAVMKVPGSERRRIHWVVAALSRIRRDGALAAADQQTFIGPRVSAKGVLRNLNEEVYAAFMVTEWAGALSTGVCVPLLARIVALADAWSALTLPGGPQLSHQEALAELSGWAGTRYDPDVIAAATAVIRREGWLTRLPAAQPRLHRVRVTPSVASVAKLIFFSGRPASPGARPSGPARQHRP